jgi:hypothetical protein
MSQGHAGMRIALINLFMVLAMHHRNFDTPFLVART